MTSMSGIRFTDHVLRLSRAMARAVMHLTPIFIVGHEVHILHPPKNPMQPRTQSNLLERNETGRVGGTDTRPSMFDGLALEIVSDFRSPSLRRRACVCIRETYYEMENSPR
jgi:hypothetical protein